MGTIIILILLGAVLFNWLFGDKNDQQVNRSTSRQAGISQNPMVPFLLYDMYLDHLEGDHYHEDELYAGDIYAMLCDDDRDIEYDNEPEDYDEYDDDRNRF